MKVIELVDSDGRTRTTTELAWAQKSERDRLKNNGFRVKPADVKAEVQPDSENESSTKKSKK